LEDTLAYQGGPLKEGQLGLKCIIRKNGNLG
jgi:hypothetical protein